MDGDRQAFPWGERKTSNDPRPKINPCLVGQWSKPVQIRVIDGPVQKISTQVKGPAGQDLMGCSMDNFMTMCVFEFIFPRLCWMGPGTWKEPTYFGQDKAQEKWAFRPCLVEAVMACDTATAP